MELKFRRVIVNIKLNKEKKKKNRENKKRKRKQNQIQTNNIVRRRGMNAINHGC